MSSSGAGSNSKTGSNLEIVRARLKLEVPLIVQIGIDVVSWDGTTAVVEAPLAPNINTHGTAFGGSLYCVGAMAGWCAVELTLLDAGYSPSVWIAKGEINYLAPVKGAISARVVIDDAQRQALLNDFAMSGRTRADITIEIGPPGKPAVTMVGEYVALQKKAG